MPADYAILHAPRITSRTFAAVLARADSPAAPAAVDAYAAALAQGVDPAVLLAVFAHESGYGRAGVAPRNHSWGNERTAPGVPTIGGFARFGSWEAGARNTSRLLRLYGRNAIRPGRDTSTVRTMPHVWAPSADGNRPDAYGAALVRLIDSYRALDRRLAGALVHPTHRTPYADVRLRTGPDDEARILRELPAGTRARVTATVTGAPYRLPDGRTGRRWVRISAVDGHPLPTIAYSAALLWVAG